MLKRNEHDITVAGRLCEHAEDNTGLDPERDQVLCGPEPIEGFDFPVDPRYPLVVKGRFCDLADWVLFVNDAYIGGMKPDGHTLKISTEKLLPWYEEAINLYALPDGWSLKDWVFKSPAGAVVPYVPGIEIDLENGLTWSNLEHNNIMDRFQSARSRINYYVKLAMDPATEPSDSEVPSGGVEEFEAMMYDMIVPQGIVDTAYRSVYGNADNRGNKTERQAMVAWLATKLQVPVPVFDKVFTFPKE